jgi:hypothetical protein
MEDPETVETPKGCATLHEIEEFPAERHHSGPLVLAVLGTEPDDAAPQVNVPPLKGRHLSLSPARQVRERCHVGQLGREVGADSLKVCGLKESFSGVVLG